MSGYSVKSVFLSEYLFCLMYSVDPDEMQHYAAFHLGIHCLQEYLFRGFPNTNCNAFDYLTTLYVSCRGKTVTVSAATCLIYTFLKPSSPTFISKYT